MVTDITPIYGPAGGGTSVTITGTNFSTSQAFETESGEAFTDVQCGSSTSCTAKTPAVPVPDGQILRYRVIAVGQTISYAYNPVFTAYGTPAPPTSVAPDYGPAGGGTVILIAGSNFPPDQQFQTEFGQALTHVQCDIPTACTAKTPAVSVAAGEVLSYRVIAVGQTTPDDDNPRFTAYGMPTLTEISPTSGPDDGNTTAWLTGGTYPNGTVYPGPAPDVRFGADAATGVNCTRTDGTVCSVQTPPGSGTVQVTITTPGGTSSALQYTYIAPPAVTGLDPNHGPATGGASVTISGSGFSTDAGATLVAFGSAAATDVSCASTTQCTATAPAGTATVSVRVTVGGQTSADTAADDFTYVAAPTVTSVTPNYGAASGGTPVEITGTGFSTAAGETSFVGMTQVACISSSQCTATTQEQPVSPGDVNSAPVTATVRDVTGSTAPSFTWYGGPTFTEINPTSGPAAGDAIVFLTGGIYPNGTVYPGPAPEVRFGSALATGVNCTRADGTVCSVHSPPGSGTVPVTITTPGGTSTSLPYTYTASPTPTPTPSPTPPGATPPPSTTPAPAQPMQVQGTVTQGGWPLFAGAVEARVGEMLCGIGVVLNGRFTLSVASRATLPGCGTDGAMVTFRVNGVEVEGSVSFQSGGSATVALRVSGAPGPLALPVLPSLPALPGVPPLLPFGPTTQPRRGRRRSRVNGR
jgi:hypothetical protein